MSQSVLIADDDASLRLLVTTTLADDSVTLLEAQDGLQALSLARQQRPNLILLDVAMPGLTGLEVCRALKADPETAHLRVIMLTAHGQAHDRQQGLAAGAEAYLTKPFSPLQLLNLVESSLRAAVWSPRETPKRFSAHLEKTKKGEDETLKHYYPVRLYP